VKNGDLDGPLLPWTTNCLTWLRLQRFVK
jgi:hypothetical protein